MTGRRLVWVLLPLLVAALALEVSRAVRCLRSSRILALVEQITVEAERRGTLSGRLLERNLEMLRRAEAETPVDVRLPMARGGHYLLLKRPQAAIRAYERALELEQRGEVYAQLGRAYLQAGDREAARRAFHDAVLLDHRQRRHLRGLLPGPAPRRDRPPRGVADEPSPESSLSSESFESGSAAAAAEKPGETSDD